ncbi:MAG: XRE family transcriptional regulator [Pseudomonadota bacterium]
MARSIKYKFGEKIREVREKKKMTLKEVALKTGVTESLISQIERNKVSPAIDTLLRIADILAMDLEYVFSEFKKTKSVNLVRYDERNKIVMPGVTYEQLSKTMGVNKEHGMEAYYMEISPDGEKGSSEYGHKGRELGIMLAGRGEFTFGNETYVLAQGDSISYESDIPHQLRNTGKGTLKAIWVTTPPKRFFKET